MILHVYALNRLKSTCWCISLYHLIALVNLHSIYLLYVSPRTQAIQLVPPAVWAWMVVCSQMSGQSGIEGAERSFLDLWPVLSIPIAKAILILLHTVGETSVLPFSFLGHSSHVGWRHKLDLPNKSISYLIHSMSLSAKGWTIERQCVIS